MRIDMSEGERASETDLGSNQMLLNSFVKICRMISPGRVQMAKRKKTMTITSRTVRMICHLKLRQMT
jgi:hypothetical protein